MAAETAVTWTAVFPLGSLRGWRRAARELTPSARDRARTARSRAQEAVEYV